MTRLSVPALGRPVNVGEEVVAFSDGMIEPLGEEVSRPAGVVAFCEGVGVALGALEVSGTYIPLLKLKSGTLDVALKESVPARGRPVSENGVDALAFAEGVTAPESTVPVSPPETTNPLAPLEA